MVKHKKFFVLPLLISAGCNITQRNAVIGEDTIMRIDTDDSRDENDLTRIKLEVEDKVAHVIELINLIKDFQFDAHILNHMRSIPTIISDIDKITKSLLNDILRNDSKHNVYTTLAEMLTSTGNIVDAMQTIFRAMRNMGFTIASLHHNGVFEQLYYYATPDTYSLCEQRCNNYKDAYKNFTPLVNEAKKAVINTLTAAIKLINNPDIKTAENYRKQAKEMFNKIQGSATEAKKTSQQAQRDCNRINKELKASNNKQWRQLEIKFE